MGEVGKLTENYNVASAGLGFNTDSEMPPGFGWLKEDIGECKAESLAFKEK